MLIINKDASRDALLRRLVARGKKMEKRIRDLENRQNANMYNSYTVDPEKLAKNNQRNLGAKKDD